jgi:hypothetical protein
VARKFTVRKLVWDTRQRKHGIQEARSCPSTPPSTADTNRHCPDESSPFAETKAFGDVPGGSAGRIVLLVVDFSVSPCLPHHLWQTARLDSTKEQMGVNVLTYSAALQAVKGVGLIETQYESSDGSVCEVEGNRVPKSQSGKVVPVKTCEQLCCLLPVIRVSLRLSTLL